MCSPLLTMFVFVLVDFVPDFLMLNDLMLYPENGQPTKMFGLIYYQNLLVQLSIIFFSLVALQLH